MHYVLVDIESDGPIPGDYSMISFEVVIVEPALKRTFYGQLKPISDKFIPEALAVSRFTREATLAFNDPLSVMESFYDWLKTECKGRALFISDNLRLRLAIHQLVLPPFPGQQPVRFQFDESGFALLVLSVDLYRILRFCETVSSEFR